MRQKSFNKIKVLLFLMAFGLTVFTIGYIYLNNALNREAVSEAIPSVPYYTAVPENETVLFNICEDKVLIDFDFNEKLLNVAFCENEECYGYNVTKTVNCDYEIIGYLTDICGGIEIEGTRLTGAHVTEMLEYSYVSPEKKRIITEKILKGISEKGFTKENLLYLIENTNTDLKFNQCYFWIDFIGEMCKFTRFIN